jgi:DNA replication and repair protein RecF
MYLTHLSLEHFRSFARLDLSTPRRIIVLAGDNAQGKTSLLEAIYYLATFDSFQASSDRQLIHFEAIKYPVQGVAVGRIVAEFHAHDRAHQLEVRLVQSFNGSSTAGRFHKEILLDGVKRTQTEAVGHFNAVIFLPQMSRIIEGGPEERRRYLNLTLSQVIPGYAQASSDYQQALSQRNALLKLLFEKGGDSSQLDYWDGLLAEKGALLLLARHKAIHELDRLARRLHNRLTHAHEILRLQYQPAYGVEGLNGDQYQLPVTRLTDRTDMTLAEIKQGFLLQFQQRRAEEIARGLTTIGPHRDDLRFLSNGIDLEDFGSRGQVRTALLALKLAEVSWMKGKTGEWPVLLLDEILAELDTHRRLDLQETLGEAEQGLLTTTDLHLFDPGFLARAAIGRVQAGLVTMDPAAAL